MNAVEKAKQDLLEFDKQINAQSEKFVALIDQYDEMRKQMLEWRDNIIGAREKFRQMHEKHLMLQSILDMEIQIAKQKKQG